MSHTPPLVELLDREDEEALVGTALDAALTGDGGAVVIRGDAGIGKTTLLRVAAEAARARNFTVLEASAHRLETELSFGICVQLFQGFATATGSDPTGQFSGAASLARAAVEQSDGGLSVPGEDRTLPLVNGLYWLCANLAETGPLMISVDDAHWGDVPSLRFLHFLARRLDGLSVALVVAMRPGSASEDASEPLTSLLEGERVNVISPGTLSAHAATRLVESELGEADPAFTLTCLRLSGGNPLYLRELLRSARDRGLQPTAQSAETLSALQPERIAESVVARIEVLGDQARGMANQAAVGGGRLHLRDAAALAGLAPVEAQRVVDSLVATSILAPGEPLSFAHPLVQAAVYEAIPEASRAGLQLRVAELLRRTGTGHEVIAAHLLDAERRGPSWVIDELEAAAAAAMANGSPAAAARYLGRALEEGPVEDRRAQLLVLLGLAETETGDSEGFEHLAAGVELLPAPEARAAALLGLGLALTMQAEVARATDAYRRGIEEVAELEGPVARDLEMLCEIGRVNDREARPASLPRLEKLVRGAEVDDSAPGRMLLAEVAAERGYQGGSVTEIRELAARALAPGIDDEDPAAFWTCLLAAYAYDDCDDYDSAERAIARGLTLARRRGSVVQASAACHPRAFVSMRRGRIEEALADACTSVEGAETGWRIALPSSRALLAEAQLERGEPRLAAAALRLPGGDDRWRRLISFAWLLCMRGRVLLEQGEPADALATLLDCGELCEGARLTNPSVIGWRSMAALAASRLNRPDHARELAEVELDLAENFGAPRAIGIAQRTLGLVLGEEAGIEHHRVALATLERSPARLEHTRTLVQFGAALRRGGSRREARDPLRKGLDLARRGGATALAEQALTELRAAGGRPRRYELTGAQSLTPSERRVGSMAADGLSNPQIAQALFVTRRTVETHLTSAYRKLDISSREELSSALRDDETI